MKITAAIEPVPLGRIRINTSTRGRYLPEKSRRFKKDLSTIALKNFPQPSDEPLKITLHFYKNIKISSRTYGDLDNHVKAVLDALNGVAWNDDAQIVELHAYKHRGAPQIDMEVSGVEVD